MYSFIFTIVISLLFSGCSTTKPATTDYTINIKTFKSDLVTSDSVCLDKSLKISQAFSSNKFMSSKMNYVLEDNKQYHYSESVWASSPNRVISYEILKLFRETKLFKSVQTYKSRSKSDFILEINIEDFMQYFENNSKNSFAKVVLSMALIDSKSNHIIATKTFDVKMKSVTLDANGGVEALNKALQKVFAESQEWIVGVCK